MRSAAARKRGFTLLEVMIGLALLALGLVVLIKGTTGNIMTAKRAQMMGIVTDLARAKMLDIEEKLMKEGFTDTDQSEEDHDFSEEGWPELKYSYKVEPVELPSFDQLSSIAQGKGSAAGSGARGSAAGSDDSDGSFENSALGGILSMLGGGSADIESQAGASFLQTYYQLVQDSLKASVRKVSLTVKYDVLGEQNELTTVAFFTDAAGLDKGLLGAVNSAAEDTGSGATGGSGPRPPTPTPTPGRGPGSGR
jgi:general secretion pathway protein I